MCHLNKNENPLDLEKIAAMNKAVVGEKAPDFTLSTDTGSELSLADLLGKKVILYFYPKDNTSGCTFEALRFKQNLKKFTDSGYVVLGVSRDSVASHAKFKLNKELPFTLLSDPTEFACKEYGVLKLKNMYGKKYLGIERSTFVINELGILTHEYRKVNSKTHVDQLIKDLGV